VVTAKWTGRRRTGARARSLLTPAQGRRRETGQGTVDMTAIGWRRPKPEPVLRERVRAAGGPGILTPAPGLRTDDGPRTTDRSG